MAETKAVPAGRRLLHQRRSADGWKLARLRTSINAGVAALDRGQYTDVEDEELDCYLDNLSVQPPHSERS